MHVVLDYASTHKTPAVKPLAGRASRFVLHFAPTSAFWLNLVERWFACGRRRPRSTTSVGVLRGCYRR